MEFSYEECLHPDTLLIPNAVYKGKEPNQHGNRPLDALFKGITDENGENEQDGLESGGGIRTRYITSKKNQSQIPAFIVIRNTKNEEMYPNKYDSTTGTLIYYGDNNKIGQDPIEKKRKGNRNIKRIFDLIYLNKLANKDYICPILYFESKKTNSVEQIFRGIAYPLVNGETYTDLVKEVNFNGIKNFQFKFTIIPEIISKRWLYELLIGNKGITSYSPSSWIKFHSEVVEGNSSLIKTRNNEGLLIKIKTDTGFSQNSYRIGQNKIRKTLIDKQGKCEICGISNKNLLMASHILPWSNYVDERGDLSNVLLLCANHDKLLDRKLITFDAKNGQIRISSQIKAEEYNELNIHPDFKLPLTEKRKEILKKHNDIFLK